MNFFKMVLTVSSKLYSDIDILSIFNFFVSLFLLVTTIIQFINNKNNFNKSKMPIINIKNVTGIKKKDGIHFSLDIENVGDSPATDIVIKTMIEPCSNNQYFRVFMLKEREVSNLKFVFDTKKCYKFLKVLEYDEKIYSKMKIGELGKGIYLPSFYVLIYYKNVFGETYEVFYKRAIFHILKNNEINFISTNAAFLNLKRINKLNFEKVEEEYLENLPFDFNRKRLKQITRKHKW